MHTHTRSLSHTGTGHQKHSCIHSHTPQRHFRQRSSFFVLSKLTFEWLKKELVCALHWICFKGIKYGWCTWYCGGRRWLRLCIWVCVCVCVGPYQGLNRLGIERGLRQHLNGNKRDNKQAKEKNKDAMKEEHGSVWKLCDVSVICWCLTNLDARLSRYQRETCWNNREN